MTDLEIPRRSWSRWTGDGEPRRLRRPLELADRSALERRVSDLRPHLRPFREAGPAAEDDVAEAVASMFQGFVPMRGDAGAAAVAKVQSTMDALQEFPAWAIIQACASIQRRGYEVVEREKTRIERHWPPSDADVVKVVEDLLTGRRAALRSAEALLRAQVEEKQGPTAEERSRTVEAWRAARAAEPDVIAAAQAAAAKRLQVGKEIGERQLQERAAEYRKAGVEPPDPLLFSLPMLLKRGWTIEEIDGVRCLVRPGQSR